MIADRVHPHVGAVRLRMTPHWTGRATLTDLIDGAGARRLVQTGGSAHGEAAVDGSVATFWAPDDASGSVRVDLGKELNIARILPHWTDASPSTYQVLVSADGSAWEPAPPAGPDGTLQHRVDARYVRVDLTRAASGATTSMRELEVAQSAR